jgi:hypothetical protein
MSLSEAAEKLPQMRANRVEADVLRQSSAELTKDLQFRLKMLDKQEAQDVQSSAADVVGSQMMSDVERRRLNRVGRGAWAPAAGIAAQREGSRAALDIANAALWRAQAEGDTLGIDRALMAQDQARLGIQSADAADVLMRRESAQERRFLSSEGSFYRNRLKGMSAGRAGLARMVEEDTYDEIFAALSGNPNSEDMAARNRARQSSVTRDVENAEFQALYGLKASNASLDILANGGGTFASRARRANASGILTSTLLASDRAINSGNEALVGEIFRGGRLQAGFARQQYLNNFTAEQTSGLMAGSEDPDEALGKFDEIIALLGENNQNQQAIRTLLENIDKVR